MDLSTTVSMDTASQFQSYQKAMQEVASLEQYTNRLGKKMFAVTMTDGTCEPLHCVTLRISVAEGVCHMFEQYRDRKQKQLQQETLQADEQTTVAAPSTGSKMDKMAGHWCKIHCQSYRGS